MSKIEMLQDAIANCECYFGCANCSVAQKELWVLKGNSFCGANGGVTKKGNPCGEWVSSDERCHRHSVFAN